MSRVRGGGGVQSKITVMISLYRCTISYWITVPREEAFLTTFYSVMPYIVNFFFPFDNQTAMQLKAEYEELLKRHNYTYNMYAAFTYDAAWSIALMLNKSIPLLQEKNQTLETMSYRDKEAAKVMRDTLFRTDFWGMSVCTFVMSSLPSTGKFHIFFGFVWW